MTKTERKILISRCKRIGGLQSEIDYSLDPDRKTRAHLLSVREFYRVTGREL